MGRSQTVDVWDDSQGNPVPCRAEECGQMIVWYQTLASGRRIPFNSPAVALRTRTDPQSGRLIAELDAADNHFRTCPAADTFRRRQ